MKKSITRNYIYNLIYEVFVIFLPLITTPYLSRVLGAEQIGIYSYTLSITTYFTLVGALGLALYGKREIAFVQNDIKARSKKFFELLIIKTVTLTIALMVFYFTFGSIGEYNTYYKIFTLEIIATMLDISWFFQGLEEFKKTVMRNIIVKFCSMILIFMLIKTQADLWKYILIYVLSNTIGNLSLWLYLPKYIIKISPKELKLKKHLKPLIILFIPQIATQLYTVLDKTMLGTMIADKSETGYYEQAQKIIKVLLTIITSLGTVMLPRMSNIFANGKKEEIKKNIDNSFGFVFILGIPMMFGIMAISNNFVPLFFGAGYDKVAILMTVISPIVILIGLSNVIGVQYLLPTKKQKEYTMSVVGGAAINFCLNLILIYAFSSIGASIATVVAELSVTGIQIFLTRKQIDYKIIVKKSIPYWIGGVIMLLICLFVDVFISGRLTALLVQIAVGVLVYFGYLLIIKDEYIKEILMKMRNFVVKGEG